MEQRRFCTRLLQALWGVVCLCWLSLTAFGNAPLRGCFAEITHFAPARHTVGQLISEIQGGLTLTNAYQCKFVYSGWNLVAELDGGGNPIHSFVWGSDLSGTMQGAGGVGGLLAMVVHQGANAGTYFYCYDGSYRVAALVNSNGQVVAEYEYGPFMELLRATGPLAIDNPFLGTTKYYDWETGNYYYGYRYYSPVLARWLSRDPLEEEGGLNLYGYVNNRPRELVDPIGLLDYYYSSGCLFQPSGYVPYLEAESWYGWVGASVYNTIPVAANGINKILSIIPWAFNSAIDAVTPTIDQNKNPYAYAMSQTSREASLTALEIAAGAYMGGMNSRVNAPSASASELVALEKKPGPIPLKPVWPSRPLPSTTVVVQDASSSTTTTANSLARNPVTCNVNCAAISVPKVGPLPPGEVPYQLKLFPDEAYDRVAQYGRTPTAAQRASVPAGMEFDHNPTLVHHYYQGADGGLPGFNLTQTERLHYSQSLSAGAVATPAAQRAQGAAAAAYSKAMKKLWGLE